MTFINKDFCLKFVILDINIHILTNTGMNYIIELLNCCKCLNYQNEWARMGQKCYLNLANLETDKGTSVESFIISVGSYKMNYYNILKNTKHLSLTIDFAYNCYNKRKAKKFFVDLHSYFKSAEPCVNKVTLQCCIKKKQRTMIDTEIMKFIIPILRFITELELITNKYILDAFWHTEFFPFLGAQ